MNIKPGSDSGKETKHESKTKDKISRRLTSFHLLQSKFSRSTPKPPITHQREVGTLSNNRVTSNGNVGISWETEPLKKDQRRRNQGLKTGGRVKDVVAKLVMAEQKQQGQDKKTPIKPRNIRKGMLLSSIMERFESIATVHKGSDNKYTKVKPSVQVISNVKEMIASHERVQQQKSEGETMCKQNPLMKNKSKQLKAHQVSDGQHLKGNDTIEEKQQKLNTVYVSVQDKFDKNVAEKCHCPKSSGRNADDPDPSCDMKIQRNEDKKCVSDRVQHGRREVFHSTCVTEWSLPQSYELTAQLEVPFICNHTATVLPRCLVLSICNDFCPEVIYKEPKPDTVKVAECENKPEETTGQILYECLNGFTEEPCTRRLNTEELLTHGAVENPHTQRDVCSLITLPKYIIPRVYRSDLEQHNSQPAAMMTTSERAPSHSSSTNVDTELLTQIHYGDSSSYFNETQSHTTQIKTDGGKPQPSDREEGEDEKKNSAEKDLKISDTVGQRHSAVSVDNKGFEDSNATISEFVNEPQINNQKPKYKTISYEDSSVKQTYKPKIIRFTDTFTF